MVTRQPVKGKLSFQCFFSCMTWLKRHGLTNLRYPKQNLGTKHALNSLGCIQKHDNGNFCRLENIFNKEVNCIPLKVLLNWLGLLFDSQKLWKSAKHRPFSKVCIKMAKLKSPKTNEISQNHRNILQKNHQNSIFNQEALKLHDKMTN